MAQIKPPSYFSIGYLMKKKEFFIFDQNWGHDCAGSLFILQNGSCDVIQMSF